MPIEIVVPRQGWSMEEGTFVGWLKKEGETVRAGEPLFTLESDKAAFDVESIDDGVLSIPADAPKPGDVVKVGCLLGYLLAAGEGPPGAAKPAASAAAVVVEPTLRAGAPLPDDAAPKGSAPGQFPASPRARRAAAKKSVDLGTLRPTGKGGRIRERDVLAALPAPAATVRPAAPAREVPVTPLRRTIAERMMHSRTNTAPVTITCRCDATNLVALRRRLKSAGGKTVPSYTDIVAKVVAEVLQDHPVIAGRWENDRIVLPEAIHIGIAVDTEHGLLVPVVRDVAKLSLMDVARRSSELIEAARSRRIKPEDMQGGCFTLTNLGGFGVEAFTPIINHPETAVLGLGAILPEPAVLGDGQLGVRERMTLSLTFDHRVVDGAPAARFLQDLRKRIENSAGGLSGGSEGTVS